MSLGSASSFLEEEMYALRAIYGQDCEFNASERRFTVHLPSKLETSAELTLLFPINYPASVPAIEIISSALRSEDIASITGELASLPKPGEAAVFEVVEALKQRLEAECAREERGVELSSAGVAASRRARAPSAMGVGARGEAAQVDPERVKQGAVSASPAMCIVERMSHIIQSGPPLTERKSTFQAHVAHVACRAEVDAMLSALPLVSRIYKRATHNIMAYRIAVPERGTFLHDCDDDGESAAGSRLLHLLEVTKAVDVCVVVSRCFGGVLLGPSRFGIINNVARQQLVACGHIQAKDAHGLSKKP